ncbi:cytochrome b5 domain-containing protein [Paucilactobacillus suebicus]|uniref:Cytochrome b5 n=1 Tax=Paucilactobacillus suebicus DSM 5007 = KCTC 3549 TaxID=1423807 RepID=A0A0R1WDV9_9LACO|nr:cytochrome b5 domain-containing protein [Paucilactobacillus suebicus]KRM12300.1 cytochrome b5 [Paucilactobacillus suebicus DSM 5007 = KCTC 3549]
MAEQTFTKEELSKFDGQNGNKAYVAIDGTVYDMTDVPAWANGQHHGNVAGQDLSDVILKSPHGKSVLAKLTVVGKLV